MTNAKILADLPAGARMIGGFIAGFLSTLILHQLALSFLHMIGLAPFGSFSMRPTWPFGIPAVFSLSFWGGMWGIIYVLVHLRFPNGAGYWISSFLFGAVFPTLVALLIVLPLKGQPLGGDWRVDLWITALLINGVWGVGTGLFLMFIFRRYNINRPIRFGSGFQPPGP